MNKTKQRVLLILIGTLWLALVLFCWLKPPEATSDTERRKLQQFPEISLQNMLSGRMMSDFDSYAMDQFPLRDSFRSLKAGMVYSVFGQKDSHGIYIENGSAAQLLRTFNEASVESAAKKFQQYYDTYLKGKTNKTYFCVVPDKSYYMAAPNGYPSLDYDQLFDLVQQKTPYAQWIDLRDCLSAEDYYATDSHWRQERLSSVAEQIAQALGCQERLQTPMTEESILTPFYGVYYGQSALPLAPDTIRYRTNDVLNACTVYNIETEETTGIYREDKLSGRDPYDFFLSGAAPVLTIQNPNATTKESLIVFRDSFAGSLIPLITEAYSTITLIDTRYIDSSLLEDYVSFDGQDVLFLYSTSILNDSATLK